MLARITKAYSNVSLFREYSLYEDNTKECVSLRMCSIVWLNSSTIVFSFIRLKTD